MCVRVCVYVCAVRVVLRCTDCSRALLHKQLLSAVNTVKSYVQHAALIPTDDGIIGAQR